jgi:predicted RNA-binding protein YlxR (DUF448 family)
MLATAHEIELDRGTASVAPGMARQCVLTREVKPVGEMIRFVVGPDGAVVPDVKRKLPGRGLWLTGTRSVLEDAVRRNVFARGFKRQVTVAPGLAADTERLLERAAVDALAIAGKAGQVVTGAAKVEAALRDNEVVALIHAADAAGEGKRKLEAALRRHRGEKSQETAVVETLTGGQLDLALNRPNVVHAALLAGPVSETFLARARRLERFRTGNQARPGEARMRRRTAHEE